MDDFQADIPHPSIDPPYDEPDPDVQMRNRNIRRLLKHILLATSCEHGPCNRIHGIYDRMILKDETFKHWAIRQMLFLGYDRTRTSRDKSDILVITYGMENIHDILTPDDFEWLQEITFDGEENFREPASKIQKIEGFQHEWLSICFEALESKPIGHNYTKKEMKDLNDYWKKKAENYKMLFREPESSVKCAVDNKTNEKVNFSERISSEPNAKKQGVIAGGPGNGETPADGNDDRTDEDHQNGAARNVKIPNENGQSMEKGRCDGAEDNTPSVANEEGIDGAIYGGPQDRDDLENGDAEIAQITQAVESIQIMKKVQAGGAGGKQTSNDEYTIMMDKGRNGAAARPSKGFNSDTRKEAADDQGRAGAVQTSNAGNNPGVETGKPRQVTCNMAFGPASVRKMIADEVKMCFSATKGYYYEE